MNFLKKSKVKSEGLSGGFSEDKSKRCSHPRFCFTPVPRGSDEWKQEMKNRTSVERVNKRVLVDYGLEKARAGVKNA